MENVLAMKYLLLIIRHMFPRKRWTLIKKTRVFGWSSEHPEYVIHTMEDQFGNIKNTKIK